MTKTEDKLRSALERARCILNNMAWEDKSRLARFFHARWIMEHEPLREDAKNLLPIIDEALIATNEIVYRVDGPWGTGKDSALTYSELDNNFYLLSQRIKKLEDNDQ